MPGWCLRVRRVNSGRGSVADFGGDDVSNKKLRNVRFEVPQMSEEMGGPVLFQTLEDAQKAAEEFGAYAIWKVRGSIFAQWVRVIFGQTSRANGSRFQRISGALSTMKDSHDF